MSDRRLIVRRKLMSIKEGDYAGWEFTAITNPPLRVLEELTASKLGEMIQGLSGILVAPWNFVDAEGVAMADPSVDSIRELPVDLITAVSTTYINETTSLPPKVEEDIVESAWTDGNLPWIVIKAKMCEFYHCLPSELMAEGLEDVMQFWRANNVYENTRARKSAGK